MGKSFGLYYREYCRCGDCGERIIAQSLELMGARVRSWSTVDVEVCLVLRLSAKVHRSSDHLSTRTALASLAQRLTLLLARLIVLHIRSCGIELEVALDDLVDCGQEVLFRCNLSPC